MSGETPKAHPATIAGQLAEHIDRIATPAFIAWVDPEQTDTLKQLMDEPVMDQLEAAFHVGFMRGLECAGRTLVTRRKSGGGS